MGDPGVPIDTSDNCSIDSVRYSDNVTSERCPLAITRTWTVWDSCGNSSSDIQLIRVQDTTRPTITCAANDTVECEDPVIFTDPEASDNCVLNPTIYVVSVDTVPGPGIGEFTHTKSWYAEDTCDNVSDTCSQSIVVLACPEPCTFTIGGWGIDCPESQQGDAASTNPGCVRDHFFDFVYPGGIGVTIGDGGGFTAHWDSSRHIEVFLPNGSTPAVLDGNYNNPTVTSAGVLAAQVLALTLNVDYSCAGVFSTLGISAPGFCYGDEVITSDCGSKFAGITVDSFLVLANKVISGQSVSFNSSTLTPSEVNWTASCLNEQHANCDPFAIYFTTSSDKYSGGPVAAASDESSESQLPTEFGLHQNYPNPFNPATELSFSLPTATHVTLEIYNVKGQKVTTLVNGSRSAGVHTVTWDGSSFASGVYFYRLKTPEFVKTKKMMLMK
jgi:hypothetical protein